MPKLFVEKSIEIHAPAFRVWEVLTKPELTKEWIREFWPDFLVLESDWKLGSPMLWKIAGGKIGAVGTVSAVEPYRLLRFSFKVNDPTTSKQEDLVYRLEEGDGRAMFAISMGDFGDTPVHALCYPGAVAGWEKALPAIKELAENKD